MSAVVFVLIRARLPDDVRDPADDVCDCPTDRSASI